MASNMDEVNAPVPITWASTVRDNSAMGLAGALDGWAPRVEEVIMGLQNRDNDIITRLVSLEARTGAAVVEGAGQMAQTQEYARYIETAAATTIQQVRTDLQQVIVEAQSKFIEMTVSEQTIKERIEILGQVAQQMGVEASSKFREQEEALKQLGQQISVEAGRKFREQEEAIKKMMEVAKAEALQQSRAGGTSTGEAKTQSPQSLNNPGGWNVPGAPSDPWLNIGGRTQTTAGMQSPLGI